MIAARFSKSKTAHSRLIRVLLVLPPLLLASCLGGGTARNPDAGAGTNESIAPAVRIRGWLHTDGQRIVDANGDAVRFRGIQITGMARGSGAAKGDERETGSCPGWETPPATQIENIGNWGFNSVRLSISWANLEPAPSARGPGGSLVHTYNQPFLAALDGIVSSLRSRGVAVIMAMMQSDWSPAFRGVDGRYGTKCGGVGMPAWLYADTPDTTVAQAKLAFFANENNIQQGYVDAWKLIAARYSRDSTVVAFDLFNEPYTNGKFAPSALRLNEFYDRLGTNIRSVNPKALLVYQDTNDSGNGVFGITEPLRLPNVVYSFHLYKDNWSPEGREKTMHYLERAQRWNVPLYVGEFDVFGYASPGSPGGSGSNWDSEFRKMLTFCRENRIGWNIFTYANRWFLQPGTESPKPGLLPLLATDFSAA